MANWETLREANEARNIEWTDGKGMDFTFRGCELMGELGELSELFINPPSMHSNALRAVWFEELANELADGVICLDLTGMSLGLPGIPIGADVPPEPIEGFRPMSNAELFAVLLCEGGRLANGLKKLERAARGWPGSRLKDPSDLWPHLWKAHSIIRVLAERYGIDLARATVHKFNTTSVKVGLTTRIVFIEGAPTI
jgi:hypothetical protein